MQPNTLNIDIHQVMVILLLITLLTIGPQNLASAQIQQTCPEADLSPCICTQYPFPFYTITCNQVALEEVKSMFNNLSPIFIYQLILNIRNPSDFIPADIFGSSRVTWLKIIDSSLEDPTLSLIEIDPNAFRSSNQSLNALEMSHLDHSRLNFIFLTGFGGISELRIMDSINLEKSIPTLPVELPSLTQLHFTNTSGLKEAFQSGRNIESLKCQGLNFFNVEDSFIEYLSLK